MALIDKLTAIADAIRGKTGKTEPLTLDQMPLEIAGIAAGGGGFATFLYRAEVTEPVRVISIPFQEEWKKYFAILAVPRNLKPNTTEWLCYTNSVIGVAAYLGTNGTNGASEFNLQHSRMVITFAEDGCYSYQNQGQLKIDANGLKTLKFATYYQQNTFDSGALELYGVML